MSALVQKKRQEMGVNVNNGNGSNKSDEQSPLRLFAPRSVAVNKNTSTKDKRSIHFLEIGEEIFEKEIRCQLVDCLKSTIYLREQQNEDANNVSHSPYQNVTSSDDTPNSITDELTNVPDPPRVQMLLKETNIRNNSKSTTGTSSCESITTAKKPSDSESGHAKRNGTPTTSNGFKKFNPVSSSSNGNNGRLMTTSSPDIATNHPLGNGLPKPTTSATALNGPRKRLLSERGEYESRSTKIQNNWTGFQLIKGKRCGIGLYNPMNNCFLNSVLQAVLHLPQLARAILESKNGRMCAGNMDECFHCELQKHLCRAIRSPFPLNPDWILRKIFPQHRNGAQEDAHEMLILLLSALEPQQSKQTPYGLKNHQQTSQSTLIEQIFGGSLRNKVVCNNCNFTHTNYEHIRELNLGLTRTDYPQLSQLIDDFFKEEQLQNFHCSMCQKMQTATRHTSLLSAPSVLIIQLKRFNTYGGKNCTPVHANPQLDLTNYSENKENINYHLYGVIEHIGSGLSSGHYVCAMHGFDNQFYLFNDSDVKPVNYNYVAEKLQPYILFYTPTKEYAAVNKQEQERPELAPTIPRHQSMYKDENRASILPRSDSRQKLQMNNDTTTTFVKYQPEEQQPRRALLDDYQTKTLPRPPSRQQNLVDNEDTIAASQQPSRRYRDAFQTAPAIPRHQNMINNDQQREQLQDTYKATTPRPISRQPQQNKNDEAESTAANQAQQLRRYLDTNSSYQTVTLPRRMYYSQYDEQPQTTIPRRIGAYSGSSGISSPFVGHRERLNSTSSNPSWYRTIRTPSSTRI